MDFALSEDQLELKQAAHAWLADRFPLDRDWEAPDDRWSELQELGWLDVAEAGLGFVEEAIVLEELGYALYPGPYLAHIAGKSGVIEVNGRLGGHVFTLLEGVSSEASPLAPGRPARKWMSVQSDAATRTAEVGVLAKRVRISPEFAGKVYDTLTPGATIIVTDQPAVRKASRDFTILAD